MSKRITPPPESNSHDMQAMRLVAHYPSLGCNRPLAAQTCRELGLLGVMKKISSVKTLAQLLALFPDTNTRHAFLQRYADKWKAHYKIT